jgi:glycosyltransferase involved in cell wall biosynthesis
LYLGRLYEEQKRVRLLERIIHYTLNSQFAIEWTIAGGGDELPRLRESFVNNQSQVSFLGEINYNIVPDILTKNDVYFLCSDYEGLPLSLLEAMGAGLVPVVSDLPSGVSDVVNLKNGLRIPIDDEVGYFQALLKLAARPDLLDEMAVKSITAVRDNFSIEAMTRRWLAMIEVGQDALVDWSKPVSVTAPLVLQNKILYQKAFKPLRRMLKRILDKNKAGAPVRKNQRPSV